MGGNAGGGGRRPVQLNKQNKQPVGSLHSVGWSGKIKVAEKFGWKIRIFYCSSHLARVGRK